MAARAAYNETQNPNITTDGRFVWNKMRKLQFSGDIFLGLKFLGLISAAGTSSGMVMMDDIAERAGVYGAFYVAPNRDEVAKAGKKLIIIKNVS